jgi:Mn2+/Fe2+ NRAMP family transporter
MIFLVNNKKIMGKYVNKLFNNIIGGSAVIVLVILSLMMFLMPLFQK